MAPCLRVTKFDAATRADLRRLWDRALGDRFNHDDADHAFDGVHVLVRDSDPRLIRFCDQPWCTVGYVEAVATDPERRSEGVGWLPHGAAARRNRVSLDCRAPLDGTRDRRPRVAWLERWLGLSYAQTGTGALPDGEHGGLMVFSGDPPIILDRTATVTCQDRPRDAG